MIHHLPVEITRAIFHHIIQHTPANKNCKNTCTCWQLDLLSVSMVCTSWYSIAVEFKGEEMPFKSLLNYASQQRSYPFRTRLVELLRESKLSNLIFHHSIRHLVIDFASFDTIRREKQKNNTIIKRRIHHAQALSDMTRLLQLCKNTERLDIICDAGFTNLIQCNCISSTVNILANQLYRNNKIKRLDFIGFNPIQRCPCCAGKEWDHYLIPLLNCLELDTLVLQHVLPSEQVLLQLAEQKTIKKIVLYQSLITLPESQVIRDVHGNFIKKQKRRNSSEVRINSLSRIPSQLWHQITSISIFEDIEDASLWPNRKYLYDLVDFVGPQLQEFTLQFGTKEENDASLVSLTEPETYGLHISDPTSILHKLKVKCKDSLYSIRLINVPENQPIR